MRRTWARKGAPQHGRCLPRLMSSLCLVPGMGRRGRRQRQARGPGQCTHLWLLPSLAILALSLFAAPPASTQPLRRPGLLAFPHSSVHPSYLSTDPRQLLLHLLQTQEVQEAPTAAENLTALAPSRTDRPNPVNGLATWTGGWNPFSKDYWASLAWSGIPAAMTGLVWVVVGAVAGVTMVAMCICCQPRWKKWRGREIKHQKAVRISSAVFGACAASLCIAGFVLLCVGQVDFWHQVEHDMELVVNITTKATALIETVGGAMQKVASINILGFRVPEHERIQELAEKALVGSAKVQETVVNTQTKANYYVRTLVIIGLTLASVLVLLILSLVVFVYWQQAVLLTVAICLLWFLCFFVLAMLTVWSDAYNFVGDTHEAMLQVEQNPLAPSVMQDVLPCMNESGLNETALKARKAVYDSLNFLNNAWDKVQIPPIPILGPIIESGVGQVLNVTKVCLPFDGPPDYLPNGNNCFPGVPSLQNVSDRLTASLCDARENFCDSATSPEQKAEIAMLLASGALVRLLPDFQPIASCVYLANIARIIIDLGTVYYYAVDKAWVGYLLLCIGAMVLAFTLTIYVLFGTSNTPTDKDESFDEPIPEGKVQELAIVEDQADSIPAEKPMLDTKPVDSATSE